MAKNTPSEKPVLVAKAALPPLESYMQCVRNIFDSRWLTNQGGYLQMLEKAMSSFLGVSELVLCANGTLALQLAIRLLNLNGKKVITTPFTYVATLSALLWEGCQPVFADIDPLSLCLSPGEVEKALEENPDAGGIAPVHVYGNACDVQALDEIAKKWNLRLLYDAAHAFGSRLNGKSLFEFGDAAIGSFHATKLFHTVEGGCVAAREKGAKEKLALLRAFGHVGDQHISLGINAKMSELHAAMGACLLPEVPQMLARRAELGALFDGLLKIGAGSPLRKPKLASGLEWNHAYYPLIFPSHGDMMKCKTALEERNIHPRRYFYPSLTKLPYVKSKPCPVAEDMAERILCLPFWPDMPGDLAGEICGIVLDKLEN